MSKEAPVPENQIICWCCGRKQKEAAFRSLGIWTEIEAYVRTDRGKVVLGLRRLDSHREDDQRLCKTCIKHILNEAADAIIL